MVWVQSLAGELPHVLGEARKKKKKKKGGLGAGKGYGKLGMQGNKLMGGKNILR